MNEAGLSWHDFFHAPLLNVVGCNCSRLCICDFAWTLVSAVFDSCHRKCAEYYLSAGLVFSASSPMTCLLCWRIIQHATTHRCCSSNVHFTVTDNRDSVFTFLWRNILLSEWLFITLHNLSSINYHEHKKIMRTDF